MNSYEGIQEQLEFLQAEFERGRDGAAFDAAGIISNVRASIFLIIKENSCFRAQQQKNKKRCARWRYCGDDASVCPFNNPEKSCEFQKVKDVPLTLDELKQMDGEPVWVHWMGGLSSRKDCWEIVHLNHPEGTMWNLETYTKSWLAYRRKL